MVREVRAEAEIIMIILLFNLLHVSRDNTGFVTFFFASAL